MSKRIKEDEVITQDALRKMRRKAERELGLQKNTVGTGPHKTKKDRPRQRKWEQEDEQKD